MSPWLAIIGVLLVMIAGLRLQGRLWICACGHIALWTPEANGPTTSQHLLDPYSVTHVLHGLVFYGVLTWAWPRLTPAWRLAGALAIEGLWELVENSRFVIERYRTATLARGYTGDTVVNVLGDLLCCAVGVFLARRLGLRRSVTLFVLTELLLVLWIRDSLLLNIVMLLVPSDALRSWQAGQ
jgi:hypothetical protein